MLNKLMQIAEFDLKPGLIFIMIKNNFLRQKQHL
jgi:hypothetical protein